MYSPGLSWLTNKSISFHQSYFKMAESDSVEVFLLKIELQEQKQRIIYLQEKKMELDKQLSECEEFEQRLINYLLISANQQDQLQKELKDLKLLFLKMDIEKRKKQEEILEAIEQMNQSLQNLSLL